MIHVQSGDYEIIAVLGIIIDFLALLLLAAFPYSPVNDFATLALFILIPLYSLPLAGLLHGVAWFLEIENRRLLSSAFIGFTSFTIYLVVARVIYQKASIIFAIGIMWIIVAGVAKFMYRTEWSKAFVVSSVSALFFISLIIYRSMF